MKYSYEVYRNKNSVYYSINRNVEHVTEREVTWYDLSTFQAVFIYEMGSEKCITKLFKLAHKLAQSAISSMVEYETLENNDE